MVSFAGLSEEIRRRLRSLLDDDRPDSEALANRLLELRERDRIAAFGVALRLVTHLDLSEGTAEKVFRDVLAHRQEMASLLGRDPGLRVAAADLLHNLQRRLERPMIVETSQLEEVERSAVTDPLTGLYNRRFLRLTFDREIRRSRRYGLVLSLILLDLDSFKRVNDEFGHLFGDIVLRRVAKAVRRAIRQSDTACRYGGEEFAVVLPETDRLGAHAVGERIRQRVQDAFTERPTEEHAVRMTISGGVASYPDDGQDRTALMSRADEALYRAKALGRNSIAIYHAECRSAVRYPLRPTARVELVGEASAAVPTQPLNLSRSGALVETARPFQPAQPVRVLLGGAADDERWVVPGRVVRVAPGGPGALRVGIAFDRLLPEDCLRAHVHHAAPPRAAVAGGGA